MEKGTDLTKSTIAYHTKLMQDYARAGDMAGVQKSAYFISLANEIGADERVELKDENRNLEELSTTDSLTGLLNRRGYDNSMAREVSRGSRGSHPNGIGYTFGLIALDIDHFKSFNDTYGHDAGDEVLKKVAQVYKEVAHRSMDIVARQGGEEFSVILPETDYAGTYEVARKINAEVARKPMTFYDESGTAHNKVINVSVGIATYRSGDTVETIGKRADKRLYTAKETGRNRVVGRAN